MNNNGNHIYIMKKISNDFCVEIFRNLGITRNRFRNRSRNRKVGTGTVKFLPGSTTLGEVLPLLGRG